MAALGPRPDMPEARMLAEREIVGRSGVVVVDVDPDLEDVGVVGVTLGGWRGWDENDLTSEDSIPP